MDQDPNQDPSNVGDAGDNAQNIAPQEPSQNQNTDQNTQSDTPQPETPSVPPSKSSKVATTPDQCYQKTSHVPIIVLSILAAIILILGCVGIWFFGFYSSPDKVAFDAVTNLMSASNVSVQGDLAVLPLGDGIPSPRLWLSLDSSSNHLPNSTTASLSVSLDNNRSVELDLGLVQLSDGVIYLQVSKVMEAINNLGLSEDDYAELEEILGLLEVIDNEWWRISVPEIVDSLELGDSQANGFKEIYTCTVNALNADLGDELAILYRKLPFIKVVEIDEFDTFTINHDSVESKISAYHPQSGNGLYEISLNKANLAGFINALPETDVAESFFDCYNGVVDKYPSQFGSSNIDATDFDEIDASDIDIDDDLCLYLEISRFSHQVQTIHFYYEENSYVTVGAFDLRYEDITVNAPNNYRPITDLIDEIIEFIVGTIPYDYYDDDLESCTLSDTCHYGEDLI